ncbi:MAG: (d)CMP kinase [Candidatus Omnitrophota bacterium]
MLDNIIAIDGPAGSGKSTVAKLIAKKLSFSYIDTGAMYRALTLKALKAKVDLDDAASLIKLARGTTLDIADSPDGELQIFLDGKDVADFIRTPQVTARVHYLAKIEGVRKEMVKLQQRIGLKGKCVLEGRDITTVVFPNAKYKFYLDATLDERAKRRYKDFINAGEKISLPDIKRDIEDRDYKDKTRDAGPLRKANDAIYLDTTDMAVNEVVDKVCSYIK